MAKYGLTLFLALFHAAFLPALSTGAVYHIEKPFVPWLWPALALSGIACELLALLANKKMLIAPGLALVLAGSLPERDLTLLVGNGLACAGIFIWIRN